MSFELHCRFCMVAIKGINTYLFLKSEDRMRSGTLGKGICFEPILANNFPDLNPNLTKEPVVCRTCADSFMISSLFKFKILETEDKVKKASARCKSTQINLRALVKEYNRRAKLVCRTCLQFIKGGQFRPVRDKSNGSYDQLVMNLLDCYPKINFNIGENPLICQSCIFESERYCRFRAKCYKTEKLIIDFLAENDLKFGIVNMTHIVKNIHSSPAEKKFVQLLKSQQINKPQSPESSEVKQYSSVVTIKSEFPDRCQTENEDNLNYNELIIKTESDDSCIENLIDYEFDEDIERKINLRPPWELVDPLGRAIEDENEPCDVMPGNLVNVLIKSEPEDVPSEEVPECYIISDTEDTEQEETPKQNPSETCVKTCVKCLDMSSECNHMKKDLVWYNCPLCSYQTHWKHHLNRHKLIHGKSEQRGKYFRCRQCPFKSPFKHVIMRHNAVNHSEDFKCKDCSFTTKFKFTLTEHIKAIHRADEQWHKCPDCSYTSKWKYHIKRHMFRHAFK